MRTFNRKVNRTINRTVNSKRFFHDYYEETPDKSKTPYIRGIISTITSLGFIVADSYIYEEQRFDYSDCLFIGIGTFIGSRYSPFGFSISAITFVPLFCVKYCNDVIDHMHDKRILEFRKRYPKPPASENKVG